jgi:hypothetical protein
LKIAIIGAGAAGIMAAITAKRLNKNLQIDLFDANKSIGKKILASGNGRCNISNTTITSKNYLGENPDFVNFALKEFDFKAFEKFCKSIGLLLDIKPSGKVYPLSNEAKSVVNLLELALKELDINLYLGTFIKDIDIPSKFDNHYTIVDIKYTSIKLKADGKRILNTGRMKANQTQVTVYWSLLKSLEKTTGIKVLDHAYILGRACGYDSTDAFEKMGIVDVQEYSKDLDLVHTWLTRAKKLAKESITNNTPIIDTCIRNGIRPNMCNKNDAPYNCAKKHIADITHEITSIYNISYKNRNLLNEKGIYKWSDPMFIETLRKLSPTKYHNSNLLKNLMLMRLNIMIS